MSMAIAGDPIGRPIRGRGANINPANRFEALHCEPEDWCRAGHRVATPTHPVPGRQLTKHHLVQ